MSVDLKSARDSGKFSLAKLGSAIPFGFQMQSQEVDSLRGIAAFLIFIFHAEGIIGKNTEQLRGVFDSLQDFVVTGAKKLHYFLF